MGAPGALYSGGTADDFGNFLGNRRLTRLVVNQLQGFDQLVGIVGSRLHGDHARGMFRSQIFQHRLVHQRFDIAGHHVVEHGLGVRLVEVIPAVFRIECFISRQWQQLVLYRTLCHGVDEVVVAQEHAVDVAGFETVEHDFDHADQLIHMRLFAQMGDRGQHVEADDVEGWKAALSEPTKVVFIESPSNPLMQITDIRFVSDLAHKVGATVIVDNVMASPVLQKPLELGADVVMYSTTKHIDGQGRVLGGAILGSADYIKNSVVPFARHTGPSMSSFNAWVMLKSLETLNLRVERMAESALALAKHFEGRKGIKAVHYPYLPSHKHHALAKAQMSGGGTTVAIEFDAPQEKVFAMMNALQVIDISNNLGDSKSLITHPASTTHRRLSPEVQADMGITPSTVRLSVGLEAVADLIRDLENACDSL